jgi:hypothetical protein
LTSRPISGTSDENLDDQKSKNADAMRIHVFIAVAMAAGAAACFAARHQAHLALSAVIICKFLLVKMRGGNLALARAAEIMLLSSLFTVQV